MISILCFMFENRCLIVTVSIHSWSFFPCCYPALAKWRSAQNFSSLVSSSEHSLIHSPGRECLQSLEKNNCKKNKKIINLCIAPAFLLMLVHGQHLCFLHKDFNKTFTLIHKSSYSYDMNLDLWKKRCLLRMLRWPGFSSSCSPITRWDSRLRAKQLWIRRECRLHHQDYRKGTGGIVFNEKM